MLSVLLEIPRTREQWERWSYHHRTSHEAIIQKLASQGVSLTEYIVEPIDWLHPDIFLQNNQQMHLDMTSATGVQSVDLQDVDLRQENQLVAFVWLHYQDHFTVETALGL